MAGVADILAPQLGQLGWFGLDPRAPSASIRPAWQGSQETNGSVQGSRRPRLRKGHSVTSVAFAPSHDQAKPDSVNREVTQPLGGT